MDSESDPVAGTGAGEPQEPGQLRMRPSLKEQGGGISYCAVRVLLIFPQENLPAWPLTCKKARSCYIWFMVNAGGMFPELCSEFESMVGYSRGSGDDGCDSVVSTDSAGAKVEVLLASNGRVPG